MKPVYYICSIVFALLCSGLAAQVNFSQKKHNFGDIEANTQRWVDINLENKDNREVKIIKVTNPDNEFEYKFSSMVIPPNGSSDIRIQFNPLEKGKQTIDLTFFFDRETVDFKITANVLHVSRSYTPCPDFDNPSPGRKTFETTFKVMDKLTRKPISKADIILTSNLEPLEYSTNRTGQVKSIVPLSFYVMEISANGYFDIDSAGYINSRNHDFVFYLMPKEIQPQEDEEVVVIEEEVIEEEEIVVEIESTEEEVISKTYLI